jgi:cell division septation protein DedD
MDRQGEAAYAWFEEALTGAGVDPDAFAEVFSARRPVVERNNPWKDPEGIGDAGPIVESAVGRDDPAGRILFVTDVEDDPIARVQAAVQLSRAAVARGLDVLLVDADIRHVGLSRWLPDRDLDAEGLVDVLQYGASVAAVRRRSEIDGIDLLGVGSYRPDAAGVFGEEDLRRLYAQLRVSAGLVVVVGPARLDERHFHPMVGQADAVILSMHMDNSLAGPLAAFLGALEPPLVGAFTWAGPDDHERFVDDALLERSRALPRASDESPFPGRGSGATEEVQSEVPAASPELTPVPEDPELVVASAPPDDEGPQSVRIRTERPRPGRRGSSGVVRFAFIAVVVVIVGFVGWWVLTWQSVEPTQRPPQRPESGSSVEQPVAEATPTRQEAGADPVGSSAGEAEIDEDGIASGDGPSAEPDVAEPGPSGEPEVVETSRDADELLDQPVESAVEDVPTPVAQDPFEAGLARAGSGWGLHLLSSTEGAEASAAQARYERQGYSAVVREATVKGRLWYRVIVGDFATKAEASGFREQAQEKFRVDWVGVVKK